MLAAGTIGFGAVGLGLGGQRLLGSEPVTYNRTTLAQGDVELRVDWREWYNGNSMERQDEPTDNENEDPVVVLENVLPGDQGRLAFGLSLGEETTADRARLQMRLSVSPDSENGVMEPEQRAGDDADEGELSEYVTVLAWYDTGISAGDTPIYGACDGRFNDIGEAKFLESPLAAIGDESFPLDAHPNGDDDCLHEDEGLCVGLEWDVPEDLPGVDDNVIQSDGVSFEIAFRADPCEEM